MAIDRGAESAFNTQLRSFLASIEDYALVRSFACAYSHFCRLGFLYFVWLYLFYQYPISILVFIAYIFLGPFEWAIIIVNWIIRIGTPANYTLKKSCELDPKRRYLFAVHPHGLMAAGLGFSVLAQRDGAMKKLFPGLNFMSANAMAVWMFPFLREAFSVNCKDNLLLDVRSSTLKKFLRDEEETRSLFLVPGGFSEAIYAGNNSEFEYCQLKERKGFVKYSMDAQMPIVPVYQFGVSKLYTTLPWYRKVRAYISQKTGIPLVFWLGRFGSSVAYDFPVTTVFGEPFETKGYTESQVSECHEDYLKHVQALYEKHQDQYGMGDRPLKIIA